MRIRYKLDKLFGPTGSTSGIILFVAGIVLSVLQLFVVGILLLLLGAFIGFSYSCTIIDISSKKIRFSNTLFGFLPTGKWIDVKPEMGLKIKKVVSGWRNYSRGNRSHDDVLADYRLVLFSGEGREILQVLRSDSQSQITQELEMLVDSLKIRNIHVEEGGFNKNTHSNRRR